MSLLLWPVGLYLLVCALMFFFQGHLVFVGRHFAAPVDRAPGVASIERVPVAAVGGTVRIARGLVERPRGVLLFFGGNGENLASGIEWVRIWRDYGLEAVFVEYPGYGESDGTPGHATILAAAEAAAVYAIERAEATGRPFLVGGASLGTFSATHVAATRPETERLLLFAPPARLADVAAAQYPWLPVRWLLRHPFDSITDAAAIRCPSLVIHGDADRVVPQAMGRRLAEALGERCEFVSAPGGDHYVPAERAGPFGARLESFLLGG